MNTYKITNITDSLGKRDANYNTTLKITYVDEMVKKTILLKPKNTIYFTTKSLPLSVHRFRVKKLVSVAEISDKELKHVKENDVSKSQSNKKTSTTTTTTKKPKSTTRKKTTSSKSKTSKKSTTTIKEENDE